MSRLDSIPTETLNKLLAMAGETILPTAVSDPKDGDVLVYDGTAKKWKNGSGGGGGGGGGWKTISVKFVNTNPGGAPNEYIVENLYHLENNVLSNSGVTVPAEGDVTLDVLAYGGGVSFSLRDFDNLDGTVEPTGTGGVSVDLQNFTITITGEGTFTAAGANMQ